VLYINFKKEKSKTKKKKETDAKKTTSGTKTQALPILSQKGGMKK
jgi:hypothetical protein